MKEYLENLGGQISEAVSIGNAFELPKSTQKFSNVLFCGVGGSAISGDILGVLAAHSFPKPFHVHRSPFLPEWTGPETLAIFSSYSGNTEETLKLFEQATEAGAKRIVLTSGGKLAESARKSGALLVTVPGHFPPRCAIGYLTFSLVTIFKKQEWLKDADCNLEEVLSVLHNVSRKRAKTLAVKLADRWVHFYGMSDVMAPVITRWRAQFAENGKSLASGHLIPEMFHNEIEGWKFPKNLIKQSTAVFFRDSEEPPQFDKRIRFVQKVMKKNGAEVVEIPTQGKSLLARLFSLIYLGDWVSYELALINKVDPLSIPTIEALKKV